MFSLYKSFTFPLCFCSRDEVKTKWSVSDFIKAFIKFHGHVYLSKSLDKLDALREKLEEQFQVKDKDKAQFFHVCVVLFSVCLMTCRVCVFVCVCSGWSCRKPSALSSWCTSLSSTCLSSTTSETWRPTAVSRATAASSRSAGSSCSDSSVRTTNTTPQNYYWLFKRQQHCR